MINLFPIQKQQEYPLFGRFNALYGEALTEYCPLLKDFQIDILTVEEYRANPGNLPIIEINEEDAFACSSDLQEDDAAFTTAGIIFNQDCIDRLGFTEEEQYAAIAHEIGHIIYRFSCLKEQFFGPQGKEIYADKVPCEIGLAKQMLSSIQKLESSGWFSNTLSRFGMRKKVITGMYIADSESSNQ